MTSLSIRAVCWALTATAAISCRPPEAVGERSTDRRTSDPRTPIDATSTGRVVWESNRSGAFRIWLSDLASAEPRQISPDEPGRDHCCARLSPDGERVAYLSMPVSRRKYLPVTAAGQLRILQLERGTERTLSTTARHLGLHRSIVWWSPSEITWLEADGSTRKLDLASGRTETLTRGEPDKPGWLVAPGGRFATSQPPSFAERDTASGRVRSTPPLGGCEPSFSADGELGLWIADAGGPIDVIELETRETRTVLRKDDARLEGAKRYLYFPSLSPDRTLLAYAASGGWHDHFRADYDIFLVPLDPEAIEPKGPPRAIAPHPGVDRYPDVWRPAGAFAATGASRRAGVQ